MLIVVHKIRLLRVIAIDKRRAGYIFVLAPKKNYGKRFWGLMVKMKVMIEMQFDGDG